MLKQLWRGVTRRKALSGAVSGVILGAALLVAACSPPASRQAADPDPASPAAASGVPAPALWSIADADTTLYLFGTVHVLPPELDWRTPRLDAALDEAAVVYFETDIEPNAAALNRFIADMGRYPPGQGLSDLLDTEQRALLEQISADLDLPMFVIDSLRPWLASLTIAEQLIVRAGYDPMSGVERTLHPIARTAGKEIRKLETVQQQLLAFADLPEQVQVDYLVQGLRQVGEESELLGQLVEAWRTGDMDALDRIMIEGDLKELPEIYQALLVRRNASWAETLDRVIADEPGVFFVAVGAGHLAGADSLQAMLAARGRTVERISHH